MNFHEVCHNKFPLSIMLGQQSQLHSHFNNNPATDILAFVGEDGKEQVTDKTNKQIIVSLEGGGCDQ